MTDRLLRKFAFSIVVGLATVVAFLGFSGSQPAFEAAYPYSSIASLVHYNGDGTCNCGSGTLIAVRGDKALVLTAAHVAERVGSKFKCKWHKAGGQVTDGVVVDMLNHSGFGTDAALVLCDAPRGLTPVPVAEFDPDQGPWINAGYGYGENPEKGNGRLWTSTTTEMEVGNGILYGNGLFVGGMSGGACVDKRGYCVGITNGSTGGFSIATSGPLVREMVAKHLGD